MTAQAIQDVAAAIAISVGAGVVLTLIAWINRLHQRIEALEAKARAGQETQEP